MSRVLVAGIGNIFKRDDAFGVEVARRLAQYDLPPTATVIDFGVRSLDLTYALLDDYSAAVLIDTAQRGGAPGDVYVIEPEAPTGEPAPEDLMMSGHELDPAKVLRLVAALDGGCRRIVVVACEPLTFGDDDEEAMGLSPPVAAAVEPALVVVKQLVQQLLETETSHEQDNPNQTTLDLAAATQL